VLVGMMAMNDDSEICGRKQSWPVSSNCTCICLEGLRKQTWVRTTSSRAETLTRDLSNMIQECHLSIMFIATKRANVTKDSCVTEIASSFINKHQNLVI